MLRFGSQIQNASEDELEEMKRWFFSEQVRLDEREKEVRELLKRFEDEKRQFKLDMRSISRRIDLEKDRIEHQKKLQEKKEAILESAFRSLEEDRKQLAREREKVETEKRFYSRENKEFLAREMSKYQGETVFFKGITNMLALRKRYKELLKIYHPDNLTGDGETLVMIGNEYEYMKKKLSGMREA